MSDLAAPLTRYRVLAWATGIFLLALTANIVLKYVLGGPHAGPWLAMIHGYLYLAYVIVAVDLWFRARDVLRPVPMIGVVLAGTIPVASFVAERYVRRVIGARTAAPAGAPGAG